MLKEKNKVNETFMLCKGARRLFFYFSLNIITKSLCVAIADIRYIFLVIIIEGDRVRILCLTRNEIQRIKNIINNTRYE